MRGLKLMQFLLMWRIKMAGIEATIERKVSEYMLNNFGVEHVKLGKNGWPDQQYLLGKGQSFYLEFKRQGEKPTPLQKKRLQWLSDNGFACGWVDTFDHGISLVAKEFNRVHKKPLQDHIFRDVDNGC